MTSDWIYFNRESGDAYVHDGSTWTETELGELGIGLQVIEAPDDTTALSLSTSNPNNIYFVEE